MTPKTDQGLEVRQLKAFDELDAVVELQRHTEGQDASPIHRQMLISFVHNGGLVMGAFKDGQLVGYLIGYLGLENPEADRPALSNLKLTSQRMGVLPAFRDKGVGYELKMAQRRYAIEQGIRLVTWTFDPLKSRNAHFNIRKLGAIAREYYRDYYGYEPSGAATQQAADRLLAEWWVTNHRVQQRLNAARTPLSVAQYLAGNAVLLNPTGLRADDLPLPASRVQRQLTNMILIEVPTDYAAIQARDSGLANAWREHSRGILEGALYGGYSITDFIHGPHEGRTRSFYVLSLIEFSEFPVGRFSSN